MKGGLAGEDNVAWQEGVAPVFKVEKFSSDSNSAKAKEAVEVASPTVQRISTSQIICLLGIILVFLMSVTGTVVLWGTNMIDDMINQELVLRNGSNAYSKWINPPVDTYEKFWLFNYTNVQAFDKGFDKKLKVEEIGPFVFREKLSRVNVTFNGNGTVTFQTRKIYHFIPERSQAPLDVHLITVNIPLMTMHRKSLDLNYVQRMMASTALNMVGAHAFINRTARQVFSGYKDTLISIAELQVPVKVGLLQQKNGTSPDRITMYTGETDVNLTGMVSHYNGIDHMDYYYGEECNRVDGFEISKFPPSSARPGSTLYVYEREACRRIALACNGSVTVWDDMPAMRLVPRDNVFDNGEDNKCFCDGGCQPSGVSDVSHCKQDAPLYVSFPHFYNADPIFLEAVDGLKPDPVKHQMYIDINERIGSPLAAKVRIQLNIFMTDGLIQSTTSKLNGDMLPIAWLEKEIDDFPEETKSIINLITYTVPAVSSALSYVFPVLVAITSTILLFCIYIEIAALLRKDPPSRVASETVISRL